MKSKIKILRLIHTLSPKLGGPSNAIIDHSKAMIKKGYIVHILTSDISNKIKTKIKDIKIYNKGPAFGNYGFNLNLLIWLIKNKNKYDFFIIHDIWRIYTLLARLLLKKYFVFIHGNLDPYFRFEFFKKIKKQVYWYFFEKRNLLSSKSILLTSEVEKKLLNKSFVNTTGLKKNVVNYGILKPNINKKKAVKIFLKRHPKLKKKSFLIYLGRFHKKKGCDILLKSIKILNDQNIKLNLFMAGPENEYKNYLKKICEKLKIKNQIYWSSMLNGYEKWGAIYSSKAMVLASHGENFGLSLAESLSCSKPVLITNKVNIYKSIIKSKSGLVAKDNVKDFACILKEFNKFNKLKIQKISKNSLQCFNDNFNLNSSNDKLYKLLKD